MTTTPPPQEMTTQQQLQAIRQKCIEANPEEFIRRGSKRCGCECGVRLADVLLAVSALNILNTCCVSNDGFLYMKTLQENGLSWNLRQHSLDDQSPETIDFLYQLLCP